MHTPYVIRGNGPPDGTAPVRIHRNCATDRPGFYASLVSIFQILCFGRLVHTRNPTDTSGAPFKSKA
jgi:hypothetical protein